MSESITNGTVIKRGDAGSPETFTTLTKVYNITPAQRTRPKIETTDLSSAAETFKVGIPANGDITVEYWEDPDDAQQDGLLTDYSNGTLRNWQLVYPGTHGTDAFAAYVIECARQGITKNGIIARRAVLAISGAVTET